VAWQSLNEPGRLRRIAQSPPQPHDDCIQTLVKVRKLLSRPELPVQSFARNHGALLFQQRGQNLKGLILQTDAFAVLEKLARMKIDAA
jgi:hypothetical protein